MNSQNVSIEVRGAGEILSHSCKWQADNDAPACTVALPHDGEIILALKSVGKLTITGDLQLDMARSLAGLRLFTWKADAIARKEGVGIISIEHPNDDYEALSISATLAATASLSVEEEAVDEEDEDVDEGESGLPLFLNYPLVRQYGAYAVGFIAALGALLFALLIPAHATELVSGAGGIALWTFIGTSENDRFTARILGFAAAGLTMLFAMAMPANASTIIDAAGLMCAAAIFWGDEF